MIVSTLLLISILLIVYYFAKIDSDHINKLEFIDDHTSRWMLRALISIPFAIISIYAAIAYAMIFWALFDTLLNKFRGKPLSYMGSTAKTDIFFSKRLKLYWATKIVALSLGIYSLILISS